MVWESASFGENLTREIDGRLGEEGHAFPCELLRARVDRRPNCLREGGSLRDGAGRLALDERRLQDDEIRDLPELLGERRQGLLAPLELGAAGGSEELDLVAELLDTLSPFVKLGARA